MPEKKKETCFVIMPISDIDGYEKGHFKRVYEHLIRPAAEELGYKVTRADDSKNTNFIMLDIISQVIQADMVICDTSHNNPNVLFELGIRQSFNKPVVIIRDNKTKNIFDIEGLRYTEYQSSLRIDDTLSNIQDIKKCLNETRDKKEDMNSLLDLLSIKESAKLVKPSELDGNTALIMKAIDSLASKVSKSEYGKFETTWQDTYEHVKIGNYVYNQNDKLLGRIISKGVKGFTIEEESTNDNVKVPWDVFTKNRFRVSEIDEDDIPF